MERYQNYARILATGAPAPSATITVYFPTGTLNIATIYSDDGVTPQANPFTADANAYFFYYAADGDYDVRLSGGGIVTPYTWGDITLGARGTNAEVTGTAGEALSANDCVFLSDGSGGNTAGRWYQCDADTAAESVSPEVIGFAPAAISSGNSGTIRLAGRLTGFAGLTVGGTYYISATQGAITATAPANARAVAVADSATSIVIYRPDTPNVNPFGLLVGFTGTPVADQVQIGDTTFVVDYSSGDPRILFDTSDDLQYTRATNLLSVGIAGTVEAQFSASGLQVTDGLIVGFSGTPTADQVQVGDATFIVDYSAGSPRLLFDTSDDMQYNRGTNTLTWTIASVTEMTLNGSGLQVADGLVVGFAGTPGADEVQLGDADFKLDYASATDTRLQHDTTDYVQYNRTSNQWNWVIASVEQMRLNTSGVQIATGLQVGFGTTPGDDEIQLGDADFKLDYASATDTRLQHDTTDYVGYNRTSNLYEWYIGGAVQMDLDADYLRVVPGSSTERAVIGGVIEVNTTTVGTVGAGEDDLMSYSMPANVLNANGRAVRITAWGYLAANANTKRVRMYFGGTVVSDSTAAGYNDRAWRIETVVVRTGAAAETAHGVWLPSQPTAAVTSYQTLSTPAADTTVAIIIKCTGEATADNDVDQRGMIVETIG